MRAGDLLDGKYKLIRELKPNGPGGGMGELWLAYRIGPRIAGEDLRQRVVLKRQRITDPRLMGGLLTEARLGLKLDHENIAKIVDVFESKETLWLAVAFVEGPNVHHIWRYERLLREQQRPSQLSIDMIVSIIVQAAMGLHAAHELRIKGRIGGIVHRDVTPDNLILSCNGNVFVIDFGIATADIDGRLVTEGKIIKGKSGYWSPEQCDAQPVDRRSDVYGLGIIATELLTGEKAFPQDTADGRMKKIMLGALPPIRSVAPWVPAELAQFVEQMRHVDPRKRIQTARDVCSGLYKIRPSYTSPEVKEGLQRLALRLTEKNRHPTSPFFNVLQSLPALPAPSPASVPVAAPEPNAPRLAETKPETEIADKETHKVVGNEIMHLARALLPPPEAPRLDGADSTKPERFRSNASPELRKGVVSGEISAAAPRPIPIDSSKRLVLEVEHEVHPIASLVLAHSSDSESLTLVDDEYDPTHPERGPSTSIDLHEGTTHLHPHIARGSRPRAHPWLVATASLLIVIAVASIALVVYVRLQSRAAGRLDARAAPADGKKPEGQAAVIPPPAPARLPVPAPALPPAPEAAPALPPTRHHRSKAAPPSVQPAPEGSTAATEGKTMDDPPAGVGTISVPASDREVRYVFVDGVYIGNAPQDYRVGPGRHRVEVTARQTGDLPPVVRAFQWVNVSVGDHHLVGAR